MKNLCYVIILSVLVISCEDVINIDVPNSEPKLVIDASINWFKGTVGNQQEIILTLSTPYFNDEIPSANGADVYISDTHSNTFPFIEEGSSGVYKNDSFIPEIDGSYNLTIIYQNETYTATETLKSVSSIEYIEQKNDGGFSGEEIEIKAFYNDPADKENYYFFEFENDIPNLPALEVYNDEFTNGNQIFAFYTEEDLSPGNQLVIRNYGISERFYEFMFILLLQNNQDGGGPFETQPATVRGNCINQTNPDNFPLGYFRVSEADEILYVVE